MILAIDLPAMDTFLQGGIGYYAVAMFLFFILGLVTGVLIWRKGYMQTHDAEAEVARTAESLERLRQDLDLENQAIDSGESGPGAV